MYYIYHNVNAIYQTDYIIIVSMRFKYFKTRFSNVHFSIRHTLSGVLPGCVLLHNISYQC